MTVNTIEKVYTQVFNVFARPVTFNPLVSQPGQPTYGNRGIYSTVPIDVMTEDTAIYSDARTILDIIETEFAVQPVQGDRLTIPADSGMPAVGEFEVIDSDNNGGGEITLTLRKVMTPSPIHVALEVGSLVVHAPVIGAPIVVALP